MQISKRLVGNVVELKVEGRVDGYWADHLGAAVDQEIRQGSHHIQLDLSQVPYLSSAGIGVLVRFHRDLKSIQGSFSISNYSRNVLKVIALSKLEAVLLAKGSPELVLAGEARKSSAAESSCFRQVERPEAIYETYSLAPASKLKCRRLGNPSLFYSNGFAEEDCRAVQFSDSSFAIGLGALGDNFDDCKRRLGEFVVAGGAVAYLPTDGTNVPDFLLSGGAMLPEVQVCYGIACEAETSQAFSTLIRFEAKKSDAPLTLSSLIHTCLELTASEQVGIVMLAESAGLIGASLRRPPIVGTEKGAFEFPAIRNWLSFTSERAFTKSVALVVGIAVRGETGALAPLLRPLSSSSPAGRSLAGHLHAVAFSYRAVQKGQIHWKSSIRALFEGQAVEGVLHLVNDDRGISGTGQSEFVRGACWTAPISGITAKETAA